jgi:creatinine deaminase
MLSAMTGPKIVPDQPEVWLRGPIAGIPPLLQPVAHALLQAVEEVLRVVGPLSSEPLWTRPGGVASVGFHVRHAAGSLDRLFTYARGEGLSAEQRAFLAAEAEPGSPPAQAAALASAFESQVDRALAQLRGTRESTLLEARGVGRLQLPSTVIGLLFHAAEHTQRHVGQIVTTARIARADGQDGDFDFMTAALEQAEKSYREGGLPIGAVMVEEGRIVARGHNRRVQEGDPVAHGEMDCLRAGGRRSRYDGVTMYTTLSPCMMCSGTILQFGIPRVVVGEDVSFPGNIDFLRRHGVEVRLLGDERCLRLMERFIREKPELWDEDIAGREEV